MAGHSKGSWMASLAFRIATSMGTNSRTGTGSGAEILASETLPGPILGTGCHSWEAGAWGCSGEAGAWGRSGGAELAETCEDEGGLEWGSGVLPGFNGELGMALLSVIRELDSLGLGTALLAVSRELDFKGLGTALLAVTWELDSRGLGIANSVSRLKVMVAAAWLEVTFTDSASWLEVTFTDSASWLELTFTDSASWLEVTFTDSASWLEVTFTDSASWLELTFTDSASWLELTFTDSASWLEVTFTDSASWLELTFTDSASWLELTFTDSASWLELTFTDSASWLELTFTDSASWLELTFTDSASWLELTFTDSASWLELTFTDSALEGALWETGTRVRCQRAGTGGHCRGGGTGRRSGFKSAMAGGLESAVAGGNDLPWTAGLGSHGWRRRLPVNSGLDWATDRGSGLRTMVELRRVWGWLGLGRRFGPWARYVGVLSMGWAGETWRASDGSGQQDWNPSFNSSTSKLYPFKYKIRSINAIRGKSETVSSHRIVSLSSPSRKQAPKAASGQLSWWTILRKSSTYRSSFRPTCRNSHCLSSAVNILLYGLVFGHNVDGEAHEDG